MTAPEEILKNYPNAGRVSACYPFGNGHINDTFKVESSGGRFILQRVNKKVFSTHKLVSNYELLVREVDKYQEHTGEKLTPAILPTKNGIYHYIDDENYAWRLAEFVADCDSYDIAPDENIAYRAAQAIGKYQRFLNTLNPKDPCDTIKNFHNLPGRWKAFLKVLQEGNNPLQHQAEAEIDTLRKLSFIVEEAVEVIDALDQKITHNDTKLNNILFVDEQCLVIDLDTVMRGHLMFDFGDMARTFTSPAREDESDLSKTCFRFSFFEALTMGYLEVLHNDLSPIEKASLIMGPYYIIYEQALRFLTDFLMGNRYYKVKYPEHNLIRTRTQLKLLNELIEQRPQIEKIIKSFI